jgi:8-oxo-dGTP pyrophosphatase MutT (NUDIX family)
VVRIINIIVKFIRGYKGAGISLFYVDEINKVSVFLGKRTRNPGKGKWSFPGGKVEKGESFYDGAVREFKEETGFILSELGNTLTGVVSINALWFFRWKTYLVKIDKQINPTPFDEFSQFEWVAFDKLKELPLHFGVMKAVRKFHVNLLGKVNN